jgi:lipoyl(octanoyl) transferase
MDLEPFRRINPCGFRGLEVTQLVSFKAARMGDVENLLADELATQLGYASVDWLPAAGRVEDD